MFRAERQSVASADRKGKGNQGKRPDVMYIIVHEKKTYELIFTECSRMNCSENKKDNDKIKLWREMNDGMAWVYKGCRPDKKDFGIIGIQIAGIISYSSIQKFNNL